MKKGKVWGETRLLLSTPLIEIHEIDINPNSYCSMHKHEFKWNAFYVLEGELDILVRSNGYDLTDRTTLKKGHICTVAPNEYHQFKTNESSAKVLEVYYIEPLSEDIVRETVGGINK